MDCNKDEALRAKAIAEEKLDKKEFFGARKFAMKAENLFPGLDGVSQMLTTIDVYISAEHKTSNGETDWYGVLGLDPSVDEEAVKKQYRKLALTLHPDKNKSVGADGAFMIISEAFGMLSDREKRLAYNQRRGFRAPMHGGVTSGAHPYVPPAYTSYVSSKTTIKTSKSQNKNTNPHPPPKPAPTPTPTPPLQRTDTFWTTCNHCKVQYEHLKIYLNLNLLCIQCNSPFLASPTPPPQNFVKSAIKMPKQQQQSSSNSAPSQTQRRNMPAAQKPGTGQAGPSCVRNVNYQQVPLPGKTHPSVGPNTVHTVHQAQDKSKRVYNDASRPGKLSVKKRKLENHSGRFGVNYNAGQGNGATFVGQAPDEVIVIL